MTDDTPNEGNARPEPNGGLCEDAMTWNTIYGEAPKFNQPTFHGETFHLFDSISPRKARYEFIGDVFDGWHGEDEWSGLTSFHPWASFPRIEWEQDHPDVPPYPTPLLVLYKLQEVEFHTDGWVVAKYHHRATIYPSNLSGWVNTPTLHPLASIPEQSQIDRLFDQL